MQLSQGRGCERRRGGSPGQPHMASSESDSMPGARRRHSDKHVGTEADAAAMTEDTWYNGELSLLQAAVDVYNKSGVDRWRRTA
jgi:hypothetical protein